MTKGLPTLLIAAHGSRAAGWSKLVVEFAEHVAQSPGVMHAFAEVRPCFIESSTPSVGEAVQSSLRSGASHVFVLPLLLTMSTHLEEDLPGLLGLPVPERVTRRLIGEGLKPLPSGLPVTLLDVGPLHEALASNALRRLSLRSDVREEEAVVLCAYGSTLFQERWEVLLEKVESLLLSEGFAWVNHAFVGHVVGMSPKPTHDAILLAARRNDVKRVHVVPLLMGVTRLQTSVIAEACDGVQATEPDFGVIFVPDAILPDGDLAARFASIALRRLGVFPVADRGFLA